jgi:phage-related protein
MTLPGPGGGGLGSALIQVGADVRNFARQLRRDVQQALRSINWSTATGAAGAAGNAAGRAYAREFRSQANDGPGALSKLFTKLNPLLLISGKGLLGVVGGLKAIAALTPAVAVLVQSVGALASLLPALIVTGLLVQKTLTTAFKGVGEAIKAVASGDVAKLDAALKNLSPSAAAFVREVAKIKPQFDTLQKTVQEGFFANFRGAFTELANPSVLGALQTVMTAIAGDFGKAAASIARVIGAAGRSGQLSAIFGPIEKAIASLLKLAPGFAKMFLSLAQAAAPFVQVFSVKITGALNGLFAKIDKFSASGGIAKLFDTMFAAIGAVLPVLGDLGSILSSVFSVFIGDGSDALGVLADLIHQVAEFFKTAEGVSLLNNVAEGLRGISEIISGVLVPLLPVAAKLLGAVFGPLAILIGKLAGPITDFAEALGNLLLPVVEQLAPVFSEIGVQLADLLVPLFELLTRHLIQMTPVAADMAKIVGPVLVFFFKTLGQLLISLLPIFEDLASFLENNDWIFKTLAGTIGAFLLILTGAVFVITKIIDVINWWRDAVVDFVESKGLQGIIEMFGSFIAVLAAGPTLIASYWDQIVGVFESAWNAITGTVSTGVENVVGLIASLPGRVSAFAGGLFNSAMGLGRAIGNGLSNIGNFASEIGGKIVNSVKSGINAIIGSINRGIASIDSFIPGALPRLSFFERGGIVDEPTLSLLGERNKKEVVLPLTDPARTAQLAEQSGLLDLLRGSGALGPQVPIINITAILDGFGVLRVVDQRIDAKTQQQGRELAFGPRGV